MLSVASESTNLLAGVSPTMVLSDSLSNLDHLSDEARDCVENCLEATEVCEWCADQCIDEEGGMENCIRLCRDVADVASLHARFMARNSSYSVDLAAVCAELCDECAEECAQHDADHCQVCADVLRECADSCRSMSGA